MKIKMVIMGDENVGKTSILNRFIENTFSEEKPENQQRGFTYLKEIKINKNNVLTFEIEEVHGDHYIDSCSSFMVNVVVIIAVCDETNEESFENIRNYFGSMTRIVTVDNFLLCGCVNKNDLENKIPKEKQEEILKRINYEYKLYYVSSKTGEGINEMFEDIAKIIIDKNDKGNNKANKKNEKKKDCSLQ